MKKMDKKAFTLIELIVVIAVIGILVLLGVPRFIGHTQKAEVARIQHDVKMMEKEIGIEFINNDDDFNEWGNNRKDLNQLVQDDELFEKEGVAEEVESIDETYKVIPKEYKGKINTKLKGTFYANSHGKVYYEHGEMPGYSDEKINDLIKQYDFIPVATAEELNNVRSATLETYGKGTEWEDKYTGGLDKKYVQVKDIDLSEYSGGEGWTPIGTSSASNFTGTYDGGSYVITGLEVKGDGKYYQGLFGRTEGATISNVGLIDNNVAGKEGVGGLVGYAGNKTKISNSYATGSVTGSRWSIGGLVGYARNETEIKNSYATGSVTGSDIEGQYIGGLVGLTNPGTKISNSYATGEVTGQYHVGGLAGKASGNTIENSFATGKVTGKDNIGGLVGTADYRTNISNSYATGPVSGRESIGGLVGWTDSLNENRINISNSYATGPVTGTSEVGGLVGNSQGNTTISNSYAKGEVTGGSNIGGLAGRAVFDTDIINSFATGSVKGQSSTGGLVGLIYSNNTDTTISNSYATGEVTGGFSAGGLVGRTWKTTISNSYATGSVKGHSNVGGLVGQATISTVTVTNSYWDRDTTEQSTSAEQDESFGKSTVDMMKQTTYTDWDFDTVWEINEGEYPTLR